MSKQSTNNEVPHAKPLEKVDTSQSESSPGKASPVWPCFNPQYPDGLLPYA